MGDDRGGAPAPPARIKACLAAPGFRSSLPKSFKKSQWSRPPRPAEGFNTDRNLPPSQLSAVSSVENTVRRAYEEVRRRRDLERLRVVRSALKESRDEVIGEILGDGRRRKNGVAKNCKKRDGGAASPRAKKRSREGSVPTPDAEENTDDTWSSVNDDGDGEETPSDGERIRSPEFIGRGWSSTSPSAPWASSRVDGAGDEGRTQASCKYKNEYGRPVREGAAAVPPEDEKKDDALSSVDHGGGAVVGAPPVEKNERGRIPGTIDGGGPLGGTSPPMLDVDVNEDNPVSLPDVRDLWGEGTDTIENENGSLGRVCGYGSLGGRSRSSHQTLVFPRLASNSRSSHYQIFSMQLCQPCADEGGDDAGERDDLGPAPPSLADPGSAPQALSISSNASDRLGYALTIQSRGRDVTTTTTTTSTHRPLPLEGCHHPRPKSSSLIFLKSSLSVEDEPSLTFVPYFDDGDDEDIYSDLFDTKERERLYEFGPPYQERQTLGTIDDALNFLARKVPWLLENANLLREVTDQWRMADRHGMKPNTMLITIPNTMPNTMPHATPNRIVLQSDIRGLERIHLVLAELSDVDVDRVRERYAARFLAKREASSDGETKGKSLGGDGDDGREEPTIIAKMNSDTPAAVPYKNIMDSYRDLFCRRCFTYDCNTHGNLPKASLGLLGELAVQKELDGHWKESDRDIHGLGDQSKRDSQSRNNTDDLTPAQQSICDRAYLIFRGDIGKVASAIGAVPEAVNSFVKSNNIQFRPNRFITTQLLSRKNRRYTSMNNYNKKWLRRIQSKVIHPAFLPCDHDRPCDDDTCSCVQNGFFCTKHCGWASRSPNFFRGCECKAGECRLNNCACYAAKRECDPDLCRNCGACCDPPGAPATGYGQRCRNDNISMGRRAHLLIAESTIKGAGWGLFTKYAMRRGDFIHEYVGEIISQEEAERRGVIYDKMNMSYLFNLSSDLVVDATRKGNKARYANHSSMPNIEPKMIHVNGDMRIGFFAKHDIDAQSELFFDYRYDDKMDNELIFKPDHSVNFDWMNTNNRGRKKIHRRS